MRVILILLIFLLINLLASAQHNFGLKASGGISKIHTSYGKSLGENGSPLNLYNKNLYTPSGQIGLFYNSTLGKHSLFGSELIFVYIKGKEIYRIPGVDAELYRQVSYIGLPFYFGYKIQKFTMYVGFQINLTLTSGGQEKDKTTDAFGNIVIYNTKFDKLNIDNYDYGVKSGLMFKLSDKLSIEGIYYYGLNNILAKKTFDWKWNTEQATLGIRYNFNSINSKKSDSEK